MFCHFAKVFGCPTTICSATLVAGLAASVALGASASQDTLHKPGDPSQALIGQPHELLETIRNVQSLQTVFESVPLTQRSRDTVGNAVPIGACPPEVHTYANAPFTGGTYFVQAGFGEEGVAAISVAVPPEDFPLRIDLTEMLFGTSGTTVTTTTEWSLLVWQGTPANGQLIAEYSSDGVILPHLVMPPGTSGTNVQVSVDPDDPEQIIVQNNGSNTFSIGYRIDKHNNQTANPCFTPPPSSSNAFPMTATNGVVSPTNNWIGAINCGTGPFVCVPGGNYINFQNMISLCTPSGDWMIRVTYTPLGCTPEIGACCLPDGTCDEMSSFECNNLDGQFQGANIPCAGVTCPDPVGACCIFSGSSSSCLVLSEADCESSDGNWLGGGTACTTDVCASVIGACCIPSTGGCITFSLLDCYLADGNFLGVNTSCTTSSCFPIGACCLPNGSCIDELSPEDCELVDGTFQGDQSSCASVSCPLPTAACCLPNGNCLVLTEANCDVVGGTWTEPGLTCVDSNSSGTADACESDEPCDGDLNGDNTVNVSDLLLLLGAWGACGEPCPGDLNGDDVVNVSDLLLVLGSWGNCPE